MADIVEAIIKGACVGQAVYNVLHFRNNGDLALATLATALEAGGALSFMNEMMDFICDDYTVSSLLCRSNIDTTPGPQVEVPFSVTYTGQAASAGTLTASALIKWVTAVGGRSGRGRTYFGPTAQAGVADGNLSSGVFTDLQDLANRMFSIFTTGGEDYNGNWEFGIWSPTLAAFNPMLQGIPRLAAKTQRRRQLGVGI
jgi:hypothetical protein